MTHVTSHPESAAEIADLISFLDVSPSPWHAVQSTVARLDGFTQLDETAAWNGIPSHGYVIRGGGREMAADPQDTIDLLRKEVAWCKETIEDVRKAMDYPEPMRRLGVLAALHDHDKAYAADGQSAAEARDD